MNGAELKDFAGMVRGYFLSKWWFDGDPDDVAQDAAVATLETHRRKRMPLGDNRTYYFRAAVCETRLHYNRAKAVVAMSERTAKHAREYSNRTPLAGGGAERGVHLIDWRSPEDKRRQQDAAAARARMLGVLEDHLGAMDPSEREVIGMLLGIDRVRQWDPEEVCAATGMRPASLWAIVRRFGKLVRGDRGAIRARRAYLSLQEAT